jgi:hypothetical protein
MDTGQGIKAYQIFDGSQILIAGPTDQLDPAALGQG